MDCCEFIHLKRNGSDGTSFPLKTDSTLILGRDSECDFRIQVPSVSAKHAELTVDKSGKVYVRSLVPTVPVKLDNDDIDSCDKILVSDKGVLGIGTCSFRIQYMKDSVSPLQEPNGSQVVAGIKSPKTPKLSGKENSKSTPTSRAKRTPMTTPITKGNSMDTPTTERTPRGTPMDIPRTPKTTPMATPTTKRTPKATPMDTPTTKRTPKATPVGTPTTKRTPKSVGKSPVKKLSSTPAMATAVTPPSSASAIPLVHTPIPSQDSFSRRSSRSSRTSSLGSIREMDEVSLTPQKRRLEEFNYSLTSESLADATMEEKEPPRKRCRKSVTFGPMLSPEFFHKRLPPSTPIKPGSTPLGNRRSLPDSFTPSEIIEEEEEEEEGEDQYEYSMTGFEDSFLSSEESEEDESNDDIPLKKELATPIRCQIEERPTLRKTHHSLHINSHPVLRKKRKIFTPLRIEIQRKAGRCLRKTKKSMPTPLRNSIEDKPSLRKTKKSMPTPLRNLIEDKPSLRKTKKSMPTPLRNSIEDKPSLRKTKKSMPTPLRNSIKDKPSLRRTKKSMPTPLRNSIKDKPSLRKTKKSMPTPLRNSIEDKPSLRKTKKSMPTPLRNSIKDKPSLRKTKKSMPTPLRNSIKDKPSLRKTKKSMPTPLRNSIEDKPSLRKTKKSMPTPLRNSIKDKPSLRRTKKSMPTPLRNSIEDKPSLRKTKKSMPTPLRNSIEDKPSLRKTKKSMPTPLRNSIEDKPSLRKTKKSMPTPLRIQIEGKLSLRKTKNSMPAPLLAEIEAVYSLRKTKKCMPTPIKTAIQSQPTLRRTKRTLLTPVRAEIISFPKLRKTKKSMPTPIKLAIEAKPTLKKTKMILPTPVREAIKQRPGLRATKKSLPASLIDEIKAKPALTATKKKLPAQLQDQIKSRVPLRSTKKSLPLPLRAEIQRKRKVPLNHVPLKPVKRAVIEATADDSPLPLPPSKKRRLITLPSSPSPYNFKSALGTPDLSGMTAIFKSPKMNFGAVEPADLFEPGLFGANVSFASPLAYTAKKPTGSRRGAPMSSRLKNGGSVPVPLNLETRSRRKRTTAITTAQPRRVTRSSAKEVVLDISKDIIAEVAPSRKRKPTVVVTPKSTRKYKRIETSDVPPLVSALASVPEDSDSPMTTYLTRSRAKRTPATSTTTTAAATEVTQGGKRIPAVRRRVKKVPVVAQGEEAQAVVVADPPEIKEPTPLSSSSRATRSRSNTLDVKSISALVKAKKAKADTSKGKSVSKAEVTSSKDSSSVQPVRRSRRILQN